MHKKSLRLLAFAFTIVFVWTGPKQPRRLRQVKRHLNIYAMVTILRLVPFACILYC